MADIKIKVSSEPYPIYTPPQITHITGRSESQINQMMSRIGEDEQALLDYCYPYPNSDDPKDVKTGKRYIVGNEKLDKFFTFCKKKKLS